MVDEACQSRTANDLFIELTPLSITPRSQYALSQALFKLLSVNKSRQNRAVEVGLIPHLQNIIASTPHIPFHNQDIGSKPFRVEEISES